MKKLFIVISALLLLGLVSQVRAEQSPASATGKNLLDNQVFTIAYNNSGSDITSNAIVVLDITGSGVTAGSTLGAYITTNTTAGSPYIFGVTDETITSASTGRVCIRGPHRLWFTTAPTAGDTVSNGTTAGKATTQTSTANKYGYVGVALAGTATTDSYYGADVWWVYVRPTTQ